VDFVIEQVRLRLDLLGGAMAPLERMPSLRRVCPRYPRLSLIISVTRLRRPPLDLTIDVLSLLRDLVGKCNFPLAAVSLGKTEAALNVTVSEITADMRLGVQTVKEQIARTIDELRRSVL